MVGSVRCVEERGGGEVGAGKDIVSATYKIDRGKPNKQLVSFIFVGSNKQATYTYKWPCAKCWVKGFQM